MAEQKRTSKLIQERQDKKQQKFTKGKAALPHQPVKKAPTQLQTATNMRTSSIADFKAKQEVLKAAREASKEAKEDVLDYSQWNKPKSQQNLPEKVYDAGEMKRQMMNNPPRSSQRATGKVAKKIAGKALKMVPLIGGIASALQTGEASAAIPILGDSENVGMSPEQEKSFIAEQKAKGSYLKSKARQDRKKALERIKQKKAKNGN